MKIAAYDTALTSVDNVLRCQPENVKALFRKGKVSIMICIATQFCEILWFYFPIGNQILEAKGEINAAIPILQKGATLEPESQDIQQVAFYAIFFVILYYYDFFYNINSYYQNAS